MSASSAWETLFFDLDGTLYPESTGLWDVIRQRMEAYMHLRLGLPMEAIPDLRRRYFETYGTTLRGLQHHFDVDADDFLAYVHDLPLEAYLKPDPALRDLLSSLHHPKWIFTNADQGHANRVLATLHLDGCFDGIIDIKALGFRCKPDPESYRLAMQIAEEIDPHRCILLDDSPRNLVAARRLGFFTILIGKDHPAETHDLTLASLTELPVRLPELWKRDGN